MPDKYSPKDKDVVNLLVRRMFKKCKEHGLTYRKVAPLVKATPSTVWSWFNGKRTPSRHHVEHIKKFMGYIA